MREIARKGDLALIVGVVWNGTGDLDNGEIVRVISDPFKFLNSRGKIEPFNYAELRGLEWTIATRCLLPIRNPDPDQTTTQPQTAKREREDIV